VNRLILSILISGSLLSANSQSSRGVPPQDITLTLMVEGHNRVAYVHVPAALNPSKKYPLVIGYHGGAGNARGYIEQSQLFVKGDQAGFIVVCPEGTSIAGVGDHRVWDSGPEYALSSRRADDILFTMQLIDKISALYPIDPNRIYATGFSNGGQMAYRIALELSSRIAAVAAMSGGRLAGGLSPSRPVPMLHIHGTADGVYPIEGGLGPYSIGRTPHVGISSVIAEWCKFNGAGRIPQITWHDGWEMRLHAGPAPVELVLVKGMGHQIAGGLDDRLPHQAMRDAPDATKLALKFFAEHSLP
jgi:polyhydroxybutyrate depolymerase